MTVEQIVIRLAARAPRSHGRREVTATADEWRELAAAVRSLNPRMADVLERTGASLTLGAVRVHPPLGWLVSQQPITKTTITSAAALTKKGQPS